MSLKECPICNKKPNFDWPEKLKEKMGFHHCTGYVNIIVDVVMSSEKTITEAWNEWVDKAKRRN